MSISICPECDTENPASEEICIQCGFPLDEDAGETAEPAASCPVCGKEVAGTVKFCDGCGASLGEPRPIPDPEPIPEPPAAAKSEPEPEPVPSLPESGKSEGGSWKLSVVEGFSLSKEYLLFKEEMMAGRADPDEGIYPDIDLEDQDDGYVSRRHAVIRCKDGAVTVEDLGGENGTVVAGRRIPAHKPVPVNEDQSIRIGKVGLILKRHHTG